MASKSYGWDVRNIAKFSPKMAKKNSHFSIFSIFSQTVHTIRTKASQKEKRLKPTPLPHMRLWSSDVGTVLLRWPHGASLKKTEQQPEVEHQNILNFVNCFCK